MKCDDLRSSWPARRNALGILLAASAWMLGCAAQAGPATYKVKGKVVRKGSQMPLDQGSVLFQSLSEPKVQASGDIQPDGTFELWSDLGKEGTVAGQHRVMILIPVLEAGQKPPIHKRYTSYETSGLTVTVNPTNNNQVTLEVE